MGQPSEPVQEPQDALELPDFELQLFPDVGIEIVGVGPAAVFDAVPRRQRDKSRQEIV